MKIPKLSFRLLLILLITLFVVPSIVFGASRGHDYLTVRGLKIDAQRLADKGEYQEAINRLAGAEGQWTTDKDRNEIKEITKHYQGLAESKSYFDQARVFYNEGGYSEAIVLFKKVLSDDINYQSAQAWLVLAEKKLAEGEGKESGSVAGVSTQSPDVSKDFNQIIPTTANPDDSPKMQAILNLLKKILELNVPLPTLIYLLQDTLNNYNCDSSKWTKQYLPNGELNPNFIFNPSAQDRIISECNAGRDSVLNGYFSQIDSIRNQISNINRQIQDIISTCATSQCNEFYLGAVRSSEAQGFIMR